MIPNAFVGWPKPPTEKDLAAALGRAKPLWDKVAVDMARKLDIPEREWKSVVRKYGWSLRLQRRKRNIMHLSPYPGRFQVLLILGDRAVEAARASKLGAEGLRLLDEAPHYPEGTGMRIEVTSRKPLPLIEKLARIKLEN